MLFPSRLSPRRPRGGFNYKYTRAACVIGSRRNFVLRPSSPFVADRRLASEGCARMLVRDCKRSSSSVERESEGLGQRRVRHPKRAASEMKEDSVVVSVRERRTGREREGGRGGEGGWQTFRVREDKVDAGWLRGWKKDEGRRRRHERRRSSRTDWRRR